jgi:uncharacterized membrane protein YhaH (DUF805 family)
MKGRVTDYSEDMKSGTILGDDGNRYTFMGSDWKAEDAPAPDAMVIFATHEFRAKSIHVIASVTVSSGTPFDYYVGCLRKYIEFSGRARRSEYWYFALFNLLIAMGLLIVDFVIGTWGILYLVYGLGTFLPAWAVSVRRLHDVGKSGWFLLIVLIPLIGAIWLLVLTLTEGDRAMNQYGDDPKGSIA